MNFTIWDVIKFTWLCMWHNYFGGMKLGSLHIPDKRCLQTHWGDPQRKQNPHKFTYRYFNNEVKGKCTKSVIDLHIGLLAETSGLVVRCWLRTLVNEVLVQGADLEPRAISPLPHQSTHLQLCQSVGEKQAANDKHSNYCTPGNNSNKPVSLTFNIKKILWDYSVETNAAIISSSPLIISPDKDVL